MTPEQFVAKIRRAGVGPAYLFVGSEAYGRDRAKAALVEAAVPGEDRQSGLSLHDLREVSLAEVIDDARSLSLFASRRLIVVMNAESALPKMRAAEDEEEDGDTPPGGGEALEDYMRDPSPGVVVLFEAVRFDFEGDDKKKLERVRKFYAAVQDAVEFHRYTPEEARRETQDLVKRLGLAMEPAAVDLLVEAAGANMARIAVEVEKLRLHAGAAGTVRQEDIAALVPDARSATIFALVNALGRRDRARALEILDTLTREGEYLPLALAFLSTQFRMALVAKEAGLRTSSQVQSHFQRLGVPMWSSRSEQVSQTLSRFTKEQLALGLKVIFEADRDMRGARPDDRLVMERFVFALTVG